MTGRTFVSMPAKKIAEKIRQAKSRVMYAAPGLNEWISHAIVHFAEQIGRDSVCVILDADERVCRLGFGTFEGIKLLRKMKIPIRYAPGLRIGCLLNDNEGWVFSPTPLLIEEEKSSDLEPNAIQVAAEQIEAVKAALLPAGEEKGEVQKQEDSSKLKTLVKDEGKAIIHKKPEIGTVIVDDIKLQKVKKSLEENPPQKFDLARQVQVFESYIEFVELSLHGCEIHRHTASIPSKLIVGNADENTIDRLRTAFQLVDKSSKVSNEKLKKKVNKLRKNYTRSIPRYGNVILKSKKTDFLKDVNAIEKELEAFQERIKTELEGELKSSKQNLVDALFPAIMENPPKELLAQIPQNRPTEDQAKKFILNAFAREFPEPQELIEEMSLKYIFKAVTYETISNADFQKAIVKAFPYVEWPKPFEEYQAIKGIP